MDSALQLIYYTWTKVIRFLSGIYIDNSNTVSVLFVIIGISILSIIMAYVLPIPKRNK